MAHPEALRWSLRPAEQADFDWAYELHKAALGEYVERTWGWEEEAQRTMFADAFGRQSRQVIEVDGQAVGVLVVDERSGELYLGLTSCSRHGREEDWGPTSFGACCAEHVKPNGRSRCMC